MMKPVDGAPLFSLSFFSSYYCSAYLALLHVGVMISLFYYPLAGVHRLILAVLILLHWGWSVWRWNNQHYPLWISGLVLGKRGLWLERAGERVLVEVQAATVWSWLVCISFKGVDNNQRYTLVVFPDSCSAQQHRELRVFLRHCLTLSV